jgi:uncharacterized protein DUF3617
VNALVVSAARHAARPCLGVCVSILLIAPGVARGADVPTFRQGVWEYERTVGTSKFVAKECIDPSEEFRLQDTALGRMGCKVSPTTQSGSTYTFNAECMVKLPSGVASWTTTSMLTAENDSAYRLETHTARNGRVRDEVTTARRVADCTP